MSLKLFISRVFKKNKVKSFQQENERLRIELSVLEKLEQEIKDNLSKN